MTIIKVSKSIFSKHKTINSALSVANHNDTIEVGPGTYVEKINIRKDLKIIGAASGSETVLNCEIYIDQNVELENLVIKPYSENLTHGIKVVGKKTIIKNCNISGMKGSGIHVGRLGHLHIEKSRIAENETGISVYGKAYIEKCVFSKGEKFGLYITGTTVEVKESEFSDHHSTQIFIEASQVNITNTKILNGKSTGITVKNSRVSIEDCEISYHFYSQILISEGSNVKLYRNKIYSGYETGIIVEGMSLIQMKYCQVYENEEIQIAIIEESEGQIANCKIYNGKSNGIVFMEKSFGLLENCSIFGHKNESPQIVIKSESNPFIKSTQIFDGQSYGVWFKEKSLGTIEGCDIFRNTGEFQVYIAEGSQPTIKDTTVKDGRSYGIYISDGRPIIENCQVSSHTLDNIFYERKNNDSGTNTNNEKKKKKPSEDKVTKNYEELIGFNPYEMDDEELKRKLYSEQKKWINRTNAPTMDKRQHAERMLQLIEDIKKEMVYH